jgi:hypothetical protein
MDTSEEFGSDVEVGPDPASSVDHVLRHLLSVIQNNGSYYYFFFFNSIC